MLSEDRSQVLIFLGFMLFFVGLLTGFLVPMLANPRRGLASHLEGIMNGMFLIVLGLVWTRMRLGPVARGAIFWGVIYVPLPPGQLLCSPLGGEREPT